MPNMSSRPRTYCAAPTVKHVRWTICNSAPSDFLAALDLHHGEERVARDMAIIRAKLIRLENLFAQHPALFQWQAPKPAP